MTAFTFYPILPNNLPVYRARFPWVGMEGVALPVRLAGSQVNANVSAGVSLEEAGARGIHMVTAVYRIGCIRAPGANAHVTSSCSCGFFGESPRIIRKRLPNVQWGGIT